MGELRLGHKLGTALASAEGPGRGIVPQVGTLVDEQLTVKVSASHFSPRLAKYSVLSAPPGMDPRNLNGWACSCN